MKDIDKEATVFWSGCDITQYRVGTFTGRRSDEDDEDSHHEPTSDNRTSLIDKLS